MIRSPSIPFLSIIIPAYNEAERIPRTLFELHRLLPHAKSYYEVLVVDDGSRDNTAGVVRYMQRVFHNLRLVNSAHKGKGGAVREGMLQARGRYRLFADADNSVSVDHLYAMLPYFLKGTDVVISSRQVPGSQLDPPEPWYRRAAGRVGNWIIQLLLLPGIRDTQCGFKAFRADVAERVFKSSLTNGWGADIETLALAKLFGYHVSEVPVHWKNGAGSHMDILGYPKTLIEAFRIRRALRSLVFRSEIFNEPEVTSSLPTYRH